MDPMKNVKQSGVLMFLCWACFPVATSSLPSKTNLALGKVAWQSSLSESAQTADKAVDGNTNTDMFQRSCTHTNEEEEFHWWMVDLEEVYIINTIRITNRGDCCMERLVNFTVEMSMEDPAKLLGFPHRTNSAVCIENVDSPPLGTESYECDQPVKGRFVRLLKGGGSGALTLCEFEVFEAPAIPTDAPTTTTELATVTRESTTGFWKGDNSIGESVPIRATEKESWVQQWRKWREWIMQVPAGKIGQPVVGTCNIGN